MITEQKVNARKAAIAAQVKARMAELGLTVEQLAAKAGVSKQQVDFIRAGVRNYTSNSLIRVREALGIPLK